MSFKKNGIFIIVVTMTSCFKELAAVDGFYHVRVAKMVPNDPTPSYVYSFVKAVNFGILTFCRPVTL